MPQAAASVEDATLVAETGLSAEEIALASQPTTAPVRKVGIIFVEVDGGEVAVPRTVRVTEKIARLIEKVLDRLAADCPEEIEG